MKKNTVKVGDTVTCKQAVESYYSNYGGNSECFFTPDDSGVVTAVDVPFVRTNGSFLCVDFEKNGQTWRVGLGYDNICHF